MKVFSVLIGSGSQVPRLTADPVSAPPKHNSPRERAVCISIHQYSVPTPRPQVTGLRVAQTSQSIPRKAKRPAKQKPQSLLRPGLFGREPGSDLLSHGRSALSSARCRFTVLFEMGRSGSNTLWPPSITGVHPDFVKTQHFQFAALASNKPWKK